MSRGASRHGPLKVQNSAGKPRGFSGRDKFNIFRISTTGSNYAWIRTQSNPPLIIIQMLVAAQGRWTTYRMRSKLYGIEILINLKVLSTFQHPKNNSMS